MSISKPRRLLALALPVVVLLAMMVRSEIILALGRDYEVNIDGFDPRDLLRGQYLRYRVRWNWSSPQQRCPECCLCLVDTSTVIDPPVTSCSCELAARGSTFITPAALEGLGKYYIPEGTGPHLERAIRDRRASLRIAVGRSGAVVVRDLLIDGVPWREVGSR
jgi:uncharacterized membrane-anchored protein